jgi:DNA replication and repair protein RecF
LNAPVPAVTLTRLQLEFFRAYEYLDLPLPRAGLRIAGANGAGKSTLLEAIELLSTTRPRRGALDVDVIGFASGIELGVAPFARVVGTLDRHGTQATIEVYLQRAERRAAARKVFRIGDRPRRAGDVVGLLPTVSFSPGDLDLVLGSPSVRRRYLDVMLSQIDRRYLRALSNYAKILSQRNGLLKRTAEASMRPDPDEFAYWDEQLVALGAYVIAARAIVMVGIRNAAAIWFGVLAPDVGGLDAVYDSTLNQPEEWWEQVTGGDQTSAAQRVGVVLDQSLRRALVQDIARGSTSVGPHRDDFSLSIDGRPLDRFGSRGQQRIAVIALKLAEVDVVAARLAVRPLVLLDDVLSELDDVHRHALLGSVQQNGSQVLITSADRLAIERDDLDGLPLFTLPSPGVLVPA